MIFEYISYTREKKGKSLKFSIKKKNPWYTTSLETRLKLKSKREKEKKTGLRPKINNIGTLNVNCHVYFCDNNRTMYINVSS